jgi:hypothetical protein
MSADVQELIRTYEQLPEAKRVEVADFARFLLVKDQDDAARREATEGWLADARGGAKRGITTDQVMALTRGES